MKVKEGREGGKGRGGERREREGREGGGEREGRGEGGEREGRGGGALTHQPHHRTPGRTRQEVAPPGTWIATAGAGGGARG